jgi:hypothetical protein
MLPNSTEIVGLIIIVVNQQLAVFNQLAGFRKDGTEIVPPRITDGRIQGMTNPPLRTCCWGSLWWIHIGEMEAFPHSFNETQPWYISAGTISLNSIGGNRQQLPPHDKRDQCIVFKVLVVLSPAERARIPWCLVGIVGGNSCHDANFGVMRYFQHLQFTIYDQTSFSLERTSFHSERSSEKLKDQGKNLNSLGCILPLYI